MTYGNGVTTYSRAQLDREAHGAARGASKGSRPVDVEWSLVVTTNDPHLLVFYRETYLTSPQKTTTIAI